MSYLEKTFYRHLCSVIPMSSVRFVPVVISVPMPLYFLLMKMKIVIKRLSLVMVVKRSLKEIWQVSYRLLMKRQVNQSTTELRFISPVTYLRYVVKICMYLYCCINYILLRVNQIRVVFKNQNDPI